MKILMWALLVANVVFMLINLSIDKPIIAIVNGVAVIALSISLYVSRDNL